MTVNLGWAIYGATAANWWTSDGTDLRRHRTDGTDESCCRRGVSAALHPQCAGMAGDPAADVLAAAGAVGARQVLPLRRFACGHRSCRDALVYGSRRFVDPRRRRRCRRGVTRPHDPRDHHRHDVHGHGRDGTASAARRTARSFRGNPSVLRLGGAGARVDQHHAVRQRRPWRPVVRLGAAGCAALLAGRADRAVGHLAVAAAPPRPDQLRAPVVARGDSASGSRRDPRRRHHPADQPSTRSWGGTTSPMCLPRRATTGYRMLVSRAGDWTSAFVDEPPTHVWVRGIPTVGVANVRKLFTQGRAGGDRQRHRARAGPPARHVAFRPGWSG